MAKREEVDLGSGGGGGSLKRGAGWRKSRALGSLSLSCGSFQEGGGKNPLLLLKRECI
jgi:hypothetical protein